MTMRIAKRKASGALLPIVQQRAEVSLSACYQCKKCSIGCPVADQCQSPPAEIIRRLQLGAGDELLQTELIWTCLSCETCFARCPNQINFAAVIDALKTIALEKGVAAPRGNAPLFNQVFLGAVRSCGRSYELLTIGLHKLGTGNLIQDMDKFPTMLIKGKMALLPPTGGNVRTVKRIFKTAARKKGVGK